MRRRRAASTRRRSRSACASRQGLAERYIEAYSRYSWPVESIDDLRLAPFHLLASEGRTHTDRDHAWHMETLAAICRQDAALLLATPYRVIDVTDADAVVGGVSVVGGADVDVAAKGWS